MGRILALAVPLRLVHIARLLSRTSATTGSAAHSSNGDGSAAWPSTGRPARHPRHSRSRQARKPELEACSPTRDQSGDEAADPVSDRTPPGALLRAPGGSFQTAPARWLRLHQLRSSANGPSARAPSREAKCSIVSEPSYSDFIICCPSLLVLIQLLQRHCKARHVQGPLL